MGEHVQDHIELATTETNKEDESKKKEEMVGEQLELTAKETNEEDESKKKEEKVGEQLELTTKETNKEDERKKKGEKVGEQLQLTTEETDEEDESKKKEEKVGEQLQLTTEETDKEYESKKKEEKVGEQLELTAKETNEKGQRKKKGGKGGKQLKQSEKADEKVGNQKKSEEKQNKLKTSIKRVANTERMVTGKKAKLIDLPARGNEIDKMPVEGEGTILKDQDAYLFELPTNLALMQKLNQIVEDEYLMSDLNDDLQEYTVYGNPTARAFGIKYADFLACKESKYTGCDIVNGYMHLLEETYNNGGKNKFFAHQFFI